MKFMIVNTDYIDFQNWLYQCYPGLESRLYEEQMNIRFDTLFGTADFYSANLKRLGHNAWDIIVNMEAAQKEWAKEHGISYEKTSENNQGWRRLSNYIHRHRRKRHNKNWQYCILIEQVKAFKPDVFFCMAIDIIGSDFLNSIDGHYRLAIGQHAAPLPRNDIKGYDIVLSSLPCQVDWFRRNGTKSELFRLGFEPRILSRIEKNPKLFDLAFVGGLGGCHKNGVKILESLCSHNTMNVWGYGIEDTSKDSPLRPIFKGSVWGKKMYQVLHDARIVFNRHIDIAGPYANNMRLYEVTGVGSFLITDKKVNLGDLFEPGRDVITYESADECAQMVRYYLENENERESIALSGQKRTLNEHTYYHRMEELTTIVRRFI